MWHTLWKDSVVSKYFNATAVRSICLMVSSVLYSIFTLASTGSFKEQEFMVGVESQTICVPDTGFAPNQSVDIAIPTMLHRLSRSKISKAACA